MNLSKMSLHEKKLLLLDLLTQKVKQESQVEEIAIVGMAGRYPMAENLEEFWQNLKNAKDCITEIPKERWDLRQYFDKKQDTLGKTYAKWGGFLAEVDQFDPIFFNISPGNALFMDPQERLFLEVVWEAFEDAGITRSQLIERYQNSVGIPAGVFVGVMSSEYHLLEYQQNTADRIILPDPSFASIANRVSWFFGFSGPSLALDTMCSSTLTAFHLACESIRSGSSEIAVVGGVNLALDVHKYLTLSQFHFASSDGRCRSFGKGGDGYVPGEGVGVFILKSLQAAKEDGNQIHGIIKGTGLNHGGRAQAFTVPNPDAQAALISSVLKKSKVPLSSISYIEAHGSGTPLGDAIELAGLAKVFKASDMGAINYHCSLGSVKSNIGHLEAAAGTAAMAKVLLQLKHRKLVPSLHSNTLNPDLDFTNLPFTVQQTFADWKPLRLGNEVEPLRAGLSGFGAGGSNAFIIIEEYLSKNKIPDSYTLRVAPLTIPLSAKTLSQLQENARRLAVFIKGNSAEELNLNDIAYTLQQGREEMDVRLALVVSDKQELVTKLLQFCENPVEDLNEGCFFYDPNSAPDLPVPDNFIAYLWTRGSKVKWDNSGSFISLPTYAFARERYWISTTSDSSQIEAKPSGEPLLIYNDWVDSREDFSQEAGILPGLVLIIGQDDAYTTSFIDKLKQTTPFNLCKFVCITPGQQFAIRTEHFIELNDAQENHYDDLMSQLASYNQPIRMIIHLLHYLNPQEGKELKCKDDWQQLLNRGLYSLTLLLQKATALAGESLMLFYVFSSAPKANCLSTAHHHAIGAFLKSYMQENPQFIGRSLCISPGGETVEQVARIIRQETTCRDNVFENCEVLYKNNQRRIKGVYSLKSGMGKEETQAPGFRKKGTYVLAGGLGSVGQQLIRILIQDYDATIILIGRRQLSKSELAEIIGIDCKGIHYISADINHYGSLARKWADMRKTIKTVHGIIQMATVVEDGLLQTKSIQSLSRVIEPKLLGTWHLDQLTKSDSLDFFLLFSSIASITGLGGGADYAFSCAFQNSFANWRNEFSSKGQRSGKCYSILWSQWFEDNHLSPAKAAQLSELGFDFLEGNLAFKQLQRLLSTGYHAVGVLYGDLEKLKKLFAIDKLLTTSQSEVPSTKYLRPLTEKGGLIIKSIENLQQAICRVFESTLRIPTNRVNLSDSFLAFGLNSLDASTISKKLDTDYQISVEPILFFRHANAHELAVFLHDRFLLNRSLSAPLAQATESASQSLLVPFRRSGLQQASFWIHGSTGNISWLNRLAQCFGEDYPIYGLRARGLEKNEEPINNVPQMAHTLIEEIRHIQPEGPYILGGYSFGGTIAFEIAQQLFEQGQLVSHIVLLDSYAPGSQILKEAYQATNYNLRMLITANALTTLWHGESFLTSDDLLTFSPHKALKIVTQHLLQYTSLSNNELEALLSKMEYILNTHLIAEQNYQAKPYLNPSVKIILVSANKGLIGSDNPLNLPKIQLSASDHGKRWQELFLPEIEIIEQESDHFSLLLDSDFGQVIEQIKLSMDELETI
ncbi:MAG: KR domain-containing protein [Tatlockia sp.]|nr:KR domain-containing protein [Tatlockia sp.]